jgi:signal transduction histidine kinase
MEEQTAQKHERQSKFMAMVAHELRNSLTPVEIAAEVLKRVHTQELIEDAQNLIESQTTHVLKLVEDLLDGARRTTGRFRMEPCTVDIADVLDRAVGACRAEAAARHQQLRTHLPPRRLNIQGDPVRLAQIFRNLLDNACRHSPDGGEISVSCEPSNDSVVITVSDNGAGIPPAKLASILNLFTHDERSQAIRHGGLGIGLGVVRDLVEAHGGAIVARSPGENLGSEFVVTLPIRRAFPDATSSTLP